MTVVVRLPQSLAPDAGGDVDLKLQLAEDAVLADLLTELRVRYPMVQRRLCDETGQLRRFVNVYIGDEESRALQGLATPVGSDTVVLVAGSIAGG